jgi:predicted RNA-binding protein with RPS1 domain
VNRKKDLLSLTLIRPASYGWGQLRPGREFTGRVTRVEPDGLFVDIDAPVEGFVPASQIRKEGRVDPTGLFHPGDEVRVWVVRALLKDLRGVFQEGQEIEARIILVDPEKKQIRLSLRGLLPVKEVEPEVPVRKTVPSRPAPPPEPEPVEGEEELTVMAYALKRALEEARARGRSVPPLESMSTN